MSKKQGNIENHVKKFRLANDWSQDELAQRIGVRRQAVYDIESGRYLPNTAVALRLAKVFGCRVEDLFVPEETLDNNRIHILDGSAASSPRVGLAKIRDRLVGFPLEGRRSMIDGLRAADALISKDGKKVEYLSPTDKMMKSVLLLGCDPAFQFLDTHVSRLAPDATVHCHFASSHRAINGLAAGFAHIAGTHLHNTGKAESNVLLAGQMLVGGGVRVIGFSMLEEGLMVAKGNPLGIRRVSDLSNPDVRLINREPGAALRVLLDDHLKNAGVPASAVNGYHDEVHSHIEGALRVSCNAADAALGLRAIADAFGLDFVHITSVRCDLVVPVDLAGHPTVRIVLDVLQSSALRKELRSVPGYDASVTGSQIAVL